MDQFRSELAAAAAGKDLHEKSEFSKSAAENSPLTTTTITKQYPRRQTERVVYNVKPMVHKDSVKDSSSGKDSSSFSGGLSEKAESGERSEKDGSPVKEFGLKECRVTLQRSPDRAASAAVLG